MKTEKKKSKTTLSIKSFNGEEKSSKNEQMCQKKHFNYRNKREYIKNNSFAFKRRDVVEHLHTQLIKWG